MICKFKAWKDIFSPMQWLRCQNIALRVSWLEKFSLAENSFKAGDKSQGSEKSVEMVGLALLENLCKEGHVRTRDLSLSFF